MNDETEHIVDAVSQSWGVATTTEEDLLDDLARRIAWLMKFDYERLLSALYLLDLSEAKFRQASALATDEKKARILAELILEREAQKLESRKRYRRERSTDVNAHPPGDQTLPPA